MAFQLEGGVHAHGASEAVGIAVTNHAESSLSANLTLRLRGLGVRRTVALGSVALAPGETRVVPWVLNTSPISPTGTSASALAVVSYDVSGRILSIPSQPLTFAFDDAFKKAFVSTDDDLGVRLGSLGRSATGPANVKVAKAADRAAVLAALGSHRGRRDGKVIDESPAEVSKALATAPRASSDEGDAVPFAGALDESFSASDPSTATKLGASPDQVTGITVPVPQFCILSAHIRTKTGRYCGAWQPQGFRDVNVSSSVEPEDFTGEGPAAYADAVAKSGSTILWQGRLNEYGCTPQLEFCDGSEHLDISTASFQKPGGGFVTVTREFQLDPPVTYAVAPSLRYSMTTPPYESRVIFNVNSGDSNVRVASIVSRILTMEDNGVVEASVFEPPPPLVIHTDDGCHGTYSNGSYPANFSYVDPATGLLKYGEACAVANEAWFGQSLGMQQDSAGNYYYAPTPWHTTQDAVTIGHELGHSAQQSQNGGPWTVGYADKPETGDCSCEWVADGNRVHCLQSRHYMASAAVEGFGHLYAARVMNDIGPGLDARFTYYKTYRYKFFTSNIDVAPPVPISIGEPYAGQGWVRTQCPETNKSGEYDWLTFFWAVNGKAAPNARSTLGDLFAILGSARSQFTWANIRNQANLHYGSEFDPRAQTFGQQGNANGLNL